MGKERERVHLPFLKADRERESRGVRAETEQRDEGVFTTQCLKERERERERVIGNVQ